ncbi:MAG: hypothetical protein M1831_007211 [Alyxoria varia]|nr:MAG: hypothetical protein M1831_007211 [Alyxoria varia]
MSEVQAYHELARALPQQLQRFFAHNPPGQKRLNPFKPNLNKASGRWHPPIYSLRRQAVLAKLARQYGVQELLPSTIKSAEETELRKERGLRIQGTGVGQNVKGHIWERTLKPKLDKRREAMLKMPQTIQDWKQRGHGRGWKKWPSK